MQWRVRPWRPDEIMCPANPFGDEPARIPTGPEASTGATGPLARIFRSLAEFTVLTDLLRKSVDARLGARLEVTGWSDGVLRVRLTQPALATRWRFQEPSVLRQLARHPELRGLREIRLVIGTAERPAETPTANRPRRALQAPVEALRAMAASEPHEKLRRALEALAAAAEESRKDA